MIKRLRIKFVCINMTIVTIMLCVIFGLVLHFTSVSMEKESIEMMQSVALDPLQLGIPGKGASGVRLPYFALQLGPGGELLASGGGYYDLTDRALLNELISLSSVQKTGVLSDYGLRYVRVVTPTMQCIVFADMSSEINTINNLLQNCLLIGAASFIIFLMISILLARWAVKPVAVAWEQQRQFVANASHELKTPLTILKGHLAGMLNGVSGYENHIEYMERSLAVVDRMEKLVKELLYLSKAEGTQKTEYKTVDFAEILRVQIATVADLLEEKKQHLEANIPTRLYCEVEQAQMERAIQNILVNAIRYSPSGELIRISLSETHGTIRGEIENTGVRVPDDAIPHLFEAFYRADTSRNRNTGGTGLGLYIVRKVMEMHRANYGISNINNGVLFWFELPCKQPVDNSI